MRARKRETCEATQLKWLLQRVFFLSAVSMGRIPAEQLPRKLMAPHESFCLEAGRRQLDRGESQLSSPAGRPKAQEELHPGVWDISKYLTDFSIMKTFRPFLSMSSPPTADPSHSRSPPPRPRRARVIVRALPVQSRPSGSGSVCADTM